MKKICTLFFLFLLAAGSVFGQKLELGLQAGMAADLGDMVQPELINLKLMKPGFGLYGRYNFNDNWALRLNGIFTKLEADDPKTKPKLENGQSIGLGRYKFNTKMTDINLLLEWDLFGHKRHSVDTIATFDTETNSESIKIVETHKRRLTPYLFAGVGMALVDPKVTQLPGYDPTQNANYAQDQANQKDHKSNFNVQVGGGLKYNLSEKVNLGLEWKWGILFNDYLDGISLSGDRTDNDKWHWVGLNLGFKLGCSDRDKDHVCDSKDACPDTPGLESLMGCPDSDGDGIADKDDKCPTVPGLTSLMGCPDRDADGIADGDDRCPDNPGDASMKGCPDRDKDGIVDIDDKCPDVAGVAAMMGCPDRDGDGIADMEDKCPDTPGERSNNGCPVVKEVDTDGDGVLDKDDRCVTTPGSKTNGGCPEIAAADKAIIDFAIKNINFETNSANFTSQSYAILEQLYGVLAKYPTYNISIGGHTDNQASDEYNQKLSERRAKACYDWLVKKGIPSTRMTHAGYGETSPIDTNDTKEGRRNNRRVEFNLIGH